MMIFFVSRFNVLRISLQLGWSSIHSTQQLDMHFLSSILGVCHFCNGMVKKATKRFTHVCIYTWHGTGRHYKRSIQSKHMCQLPKDFQKWHQFLFHLHQHNCITHNNTHVKNYVQTLHALAPNTLPTPLAKTITTLHHLHPLVEVDFPPFVNDFHLEMDLALDK